MRRVIINADDFAMDAGGDAAILDLAARGAVTATSAMVLSPFWAEAGTRLAGAPIDRGLHLDLTSPFARDVFDVMPLWRLTVHAHAGRLNRSRLRQAIELQFSRFEDVIGHQPDFVDGHHHVHHLPQIREALIEVLSGRYGANAHCVGLRICTPRRWRGTKAAIIDKTGAPALDRLAKASGHSVNTDFAGVYSFSEDANLPVLWRDWLSRLEGDAPIIMCHVAVPAEGSLDGDTIRGARLREYEWLSSEAFHELCHSGSRLPGRWPRV